MGSDGGLWHHRDRVAVGGPPLVEILNGVYYLDCNWFHPKHRFTMKAFSYSSSPHLLVPCIL